MGIIWRALSQDYGNVARLVVFVGYDDQVRTLYSVTWRLITPYDYPYCRRMSTYQNTHEYLIGND
jgi:hypothetical protein